MTDAKHLSSVTRDETPAAPAREDDWLDEVPLDELAESHRELVVAVGSLRHAIKISEAWGGVYRYIPKMDKALNALRNRRIRQAFTGCNHRELARKFNLSETWIRKILEQTAEADDRQASLFGEPDRDPTLPP